MAKEHGTRGRYNDGCRCSPCKKANSDYYRDRRSGKPAKPVKKLPRKLKAVPNVYTDVYTSRTPESGPPAAEVQSVEAAVREQLARLSTVESRGGEVAAALALARVLDDPDRMSHHAAAAHRLGEYIESLRKGSDKKAGRLAAVRRMSRPQLSQHDDVHGQTS
ncbi:hypothetical protein QN239_27420 [Mycolicibacterium sp. Y3]